jgi:hypothetical protein
LWYPTSREKRARYGAPFVCLEGESLKVNSCVDGLEA